MLGRLLLEPPGPALAESFRDGAMRATWPFEDARTAAALALVGEDSPEELQREYLRVFHGPDPVIPLGESAWREGADPREVRAELMKAFARNDLRPLPHTDNLGHHLVLLATLATRAARAVNGDDEPTARAVVAEAGRFRETHVDGVVEPLLTAIGDHARTGLYRAVPGLVRGFLAEHAALCATILDR